MIAGLECDLHTHHRVASSTQKCLDWEHFESRSVVAFVLISIGNVRDYTQGIPVRQPDDMEMRKPTEQWRIKQKTNQSHRMPYTILYLTRPHDNIKSMFILIVVALLSSPKAQADGSPSPS